MTADSKTIPATLIPGDGIGPEIVESVTEILDAVGAPFTWDSQLAGMAGVDAVNDPLPKQTIESIRRTGLALKGPLTTPVGGGFKSINVTLRQEFGLFANLRPTKTIVPEILRRVRLDDAMKAKKLKQALVQLAEEGVVQLFRPQDGASPIVGVVVTLQLDVLQARLQAEYGVAIGFDSTPFSLARWVTGPRDKIEAFAMANRNAMADDLDDDPVFLATSSFMMRRTEEQNPDIRFHDIKQIGIGVG